MIITAVRPQTRDKNRVNISIDGKYSFSLDVAQLVDYKLKVGLELDDEQLNDLESASQLGKLYDKALAYCLIRPRSFKEVSDYLYRKTQPKKDKAGNFKAYYNQSQLGGVLELLSSKGYIDNYKFAEFWVDNRFAKKGISRRRLTTELIQKGIDADIIKQVLDGCLRDDTNELKKVITKKAKLYSDRNKLMNYLIRQGFNYEDVVSSLDELLG